jgi:hypothetical protein
MSRHRGQSDSRKVGDSCENRSLGWDQLAIGPSTKTYEANSIASSKGYHRSVCAWIQRSDLSASALLATGRNVDRNGSRGAVVDQCRPSGEGTFHGGTV